MRFTVKCANMGMTGVIEYVTDAPNQEKALELATNALPGYGSYRVVRIEDTNNHAIIEKVKSRGRPKKNNLEK